MVGGDVYGLIEWDDAPILIVGPQHRRHPT
jgi:hypothetical protein